MGVFYGKSTVKENTATCSVLLVYNELHKYGWRYAQR